MANFENSSRTYQDLQNSFVSNLNGTTSFEISLVTSFAPLSLVLRTLLSSFVWRYQPTSTASASSLAFIVEYVTLILPTLLVFTVIADYAFIFIVLLFAIFPVIVSSTFQQNYNIQKTMMTPNAQHKKVFVSHFRAYILITTAISILAVDFVVYPRRFAKTETFGTGLMDIGVGCFTFSNAIVSNEARGLLNSDHSNSLLKSLGKEIKAVFLLLCFGLARFISVKSTNYQEHVSEYGVHWNFFLTIAAVRIYSTIIIGMLPHFMRRHSWILGFVLGLSYHYALVHGLEHFILHGSLGDGSRTNLIDANREGICSCLGYLSLYFFGIGVGKLVFRKKENNLKCDLELLLSLVIIAALAWSVLFYWTSYVGLISRRQANFAFVLWQIAINIQLLAMFLVVEILLTTVGCQNMFFLKPGGCTACYTTNKRAETLQQKKKDISTPKTDRVQTPGPSSNDLNQASCRHSKSDHLTNHTGYPQESRQCQCLLSAVNFNQLGYFIIANLLTGIVNLSMKTIHASPLLAFIILNIYLLVLNIIIMVLYRYRILLKI